MTSFGDFLKAATGHALTPDQERLAASGKPCAFVHGSKAFGKHVESVRRTADKLIAGQTVMVACASTSYADRFAHDLKAELTTRGKLGVLDRAEIIDVSTMSAVRSDEPTSLHVYDFIDDYADGEETGASGRPPSSEARRAFYDEVAKRVGEGRPR